MNESSEMAANDHTTTLNNNVNPGRGTGAGLASVGDALASAGVPLTTSPGAGRALGLEGMTMAQALASCERPAGPLLLAVQGQMDLAIATRSARKLAGRMLADGHDVGQDRIKDAIGAGCLALACWRAGVTITRGTDGGDVVMSGAVAWELAARVAWRGAVAFLSADNLGDTVPLMGGAEDDWLCAQVLPGESRTERAARRWIERHAGQRQNLLARRLANVSTGRGRRAAAVDKVGRAAAFLLGGDAMEAAAAAAGFKARERHSAADTFLQAAKRLKLIPGGFTARMRGGRSEAGLKHVVPVEVRAFVPSVCLPGDYIKPGGVVEVPPGHHLAKAVSGLPVEVVGESRRGVASRGAVLAAAGLYFRRRKLRGVLRSV